MIFHNLRYILPSVFFIFICYIIFLADTADHNFAFRTIGHIPYGDKFMHAILYGTMAFLLNWALNFKFIIYLKINIQIGSSLVLVFALLEEISQCFIASRTFAFFDILADLIGIIIFSFFRLK